MAALPRLTTIWARDGRRGNRTMRIASRQITVEVHIAEAGVPRLRQPALGMTQRGAASTRDDRICMTASDDSYAKISAGISGSAEPSPRRRFARRGLSREIPGEVFRMEADFKIRKCPSPAARRRASHPTLADERRPLPTQGEAIIWRGKLRMRGGDPDCYCGAFADFAFYA